MKKTQLLICLLLALLLAGCINTATTKTLTDRLTVYASAYPIADFAAKIGGEKIQVVNLVPAGAQPHSFEPSSKAVAELSRAKLFIYNGAGLEHYLPKLAKTLEGTGVKLVDTSAGIDLLHNEAGKGHGHEGELHEEGEYDPHIWLSPTRAAQQCQAIYQALAQIDPANAGYYKANLEKFQGELQQLDREYRTIISKCPVKNLVISHAAFAYLAEDYGLRQISLMGVNADAEPGPATLKEVILFVRQEKLRYVFWDPLDSPKLVQTLAEESQVSFLPLNSLGALSEKELQEGQDYLSVMRSNLISLQKGLGYQP